MIQNPFHNDSWFFEVVGQDKRVKYMAKQSYIEFLKREKKNKRIFPFFFLLKISLVELTYILTTNILIALFLFGSLTTTVTLTVEAVVPKQFKPSNIIKNLKDQVWKRSEALLPPSSTPELTPPSTLVVSESAVSGVSNSAPISSQKSSSSRLPVVISASSQSSMYQIRVSSSKPSAQKAVSSIAVSSRASSKQSSSAAASMAPQPQPVRAILECVQSLQNSSSTAYYGYLNENSTAITITGSNNQLNPSAYNGKQVTVFQPGRVFRAFSVTVPSDTVLVWTLTGPDGKTRTATASENSTPCPNP